MRSIGPEKTEGKHATRGAVIHKRTKVSDLPNNQRNRLLNSIAIPFH
jgi:hypothetical protein